MRDDEKEDDHILPIGHRQHLGGNDWLSLHRASFSHDPNDIATNATTPTTATTPPITADDEKDDGRRMTKICRR